MAPALPQAAGEPVHRGRGPWAAWPFWAIALTHALLLLRGGSFAGGAIHDALGSYQALFLGSFVIAVMAVVLGVTLRSPAPVMVPGRAPCREAERAVSR